MLKSPLGRFTSGIIVLALLLMGCEETTTSDLLLTNGRVYTFAWDEPALDGTPAANAPFDSTKGWSPNAEAIAIKDREIVFVGSATEAEEYAGSNTRRVNLKGATVLPGMRDAHVHIGDLGRALTQVNLKDVSSEAEIVEQVVTRAKETPQGRWIVGWGWDEGAFADNYPNKERLSERVPDHPVYLKGLHGFAGLANEMALERAGVTADTESPQGGTIGRYEDGTPTGIFRNRAVTLITDVIPPPSLDQKKEQVRTALQEMARSGYVGVHEAGADSLLVEAFESLARDDHLPIRVYAMLNGRNEPLIQSWLERGPETDPSDRLLARSIKFFYDGALGSRGALLLEDYSDKTGHRGVGDAEYGFDRDLAAEVMSAGFQVGVHTIGDAANRQTLNFIDSVYASNPDARNYRHRLEHAQVIHPDDLSRLGELDLIASMQPPHAVEDKDWAEERLGSDRMSGAYAWRTLRKNGADLVFSSDLPGSDHDLFYGLHAAVARRDKDKQPPGGWYSEESLTVEESIRAYSTWAAYASFLEEQTGTLQSGRWADLTVVDIDPMTTQPDNYGRLLEGEIQMTVVEGEIVYSRY
jgi:predicted amidohydrolase YtcJ